MTVRKRIHLALSLNGALGSGGYSHISICDVKRQIREGTIFAYLDQMLGSSIDFGELKAGEKRALVKEWQNLIDAADEAKTLHVETNGLCLLVAYLLQGIQQDVLGMTAT